jgi:hypothetical protein
MLTEARSFLSGVYLGAVLSRQTGVDRQLGMTVRSWRVLVYGAKDDLDDAGGGLCVRPAKKMIVVTAAVVVVVVSAMPEDLARHKRVSIDVECADRHLLDGSRWIQSANWMRPRDTACYKVN